MQKLNLKTDDLEKGETIIITGPTTGVMDYTVDEIRVDLKETQKANKGVLCSLKVDDRVRRSDKVYKWVDADKG